MILLLWIFLILNAIASIQSSLFHSIALFRTDKVLESEMDTTITSTIVSPSDLKLSFNTSTISPSKKIQNKKIQIVLCRHGETTANRDNLLQGHCNYPLTQDGLHMAIQVGKALKNTKFLKVYSSDLKRAHKTAQLILNENIKPSLKLERSILLREVSFGIREGLTRGTTIEEAKLIVSRKENLHIDDIEDFAETDEEIMKRQKVFLNQLVLDIYDDYMLNDPSLSSSSIVSTDENQIDEYDMPNILCVTHSAFIRHLLSTYTDIKKENIKIKNCSLTIIELEFDILNPTKFTIYVDKNKINLVSHLAPINKHQNE